MKRKNIFTAIITILILFIVVLCLNVFVQQKFIKTYTYTELEYRGYTSQDVSELKIMHSYLNRLLSYNEWRISVEFEKEPDILFWFTYRDNKIVFQGVSSEPMLDKESILDYSERFKNGTLLVEKDKTKVDTEILNSEFCLISSDDAKIILNSDITLFNKEPLNEKEDRGDGFHWKEYTYEDIFVKALLGDYDTTSIILISTTSNNYKTPRGIKVGDSLQQLQEKYPSFLAKANSNEIYYIYETDDIGFNRIHFYIENDLITKIVLENGIDG